MSFPRVLVAAGALILVGCPGSADEPARGGTLVVALRSDVDSWNPYATRDPSAGALLDLLYPRLVRKGAQGFEPWLASSWDPSEDGLSITFHLRPDAVWTNGTPVTCDDVRFTRQARTSDALDWPGAALETRVRAVDCSDAHTAVFRFSRRYPDQIADAASGAVVPAVYGYVPLGEWEDTAWERRMITCGPFRLASAAEGKEAVLRRDPKWWAAVDVHLDRIVLRSFRDADAALARFLAGEVDVIPGVPPLRDGEVRNHPGVALLEVPTLSYTYLAWNVLEPGAYLADRRRRQCDVGRACAEHPSDILRLRREHPHPILSDSRVRRALSLATDRQGLVNRLQGGHATIGTSPIVSALWAHEPACALPYDPDMARALLDEAGWRDENGDGVLDRDGRPLEIRVLVNEADRARREVLDHVAAGLARVGVRLLAQAVPRGELASRTRFKEFDAVLGGSRPDARVEPQAILHTRAAVHRGANVTAWSTPESDALLDRAGEAATRAEAEPLWSRWQMIFRVEQPYTILYEETLLFGLSARVRGADPAAPHPFPGLYRLWVTNAP
jgi:peptide/nickel transport system substrate-binding protein